MGIDIIAISKARLVRAGHSSDLCDEEEHWDTGDERRYLDRKTPGCYISDGKSIGFSVNYHGYDEWRNTLCWLMLGVDAETAWDQPRRFAGEPFVELIDLPDAGYYSFGPVTSKKLAGDFVKYAAEAKQGFMALADACLQHQKVRQKSLKSKRAPKAKRDDILDESQDGGLLAGSTDWRWKWDIYRDFQKAFQIASDNGFVIVA